ncbi:MAG: hypothetical protein GF353_16355 [Candidatus Lokiarchaeota archaeon]|nr:hypothetical protein [Candidatus Lokiarchaeota archaeon]
MEFKDKQFDGPYEVTEIQIENDGEILRGMLYFPSEAYEKPYPLVFYFHGFPQLLALQELIKRYRVLLDLGYALIVFNFRGFSISEGEFSLDNCVSDGEKLIKFAKKMAEKKIFNINDINIISFDFGTYVSLILSSKLKQINRLFLLSPILNLKEIVYRDEFKKNLSYINRYLPGSVRGIEDIELFLETTKKELSKKQFQIQDSIKNLFVDKIKIVIGTEDKLTSISTLKDFFKSSNIDPEITIIDNMEHEPFEDEEISRVNEEIKQFFQ